MSGNILTIVATYLSIYFQMELTHAWHDHLDSGHEMKYMSAHNIV